MMEKKQDGFTVSSIYLAPEGGHPMVRVNNVEARRDQGLVGDRYASRKGFWQNIAKPSSIVRDVSIINSRDIVNSGFLESETRRNIVVTGDFTLSELIGKTFYIGEVMFLGTDDCAPCRRPSDLCGKPGFAKIFADKGGLRARVLNDAVLRVSDHFRIAEASVPGSLQ